jgi:hypothetical protein
MNDIPGAGATIVTIGTTVTPINPVPIPGAVWLLGSGLLGLVGIGRKRLKKV